jgi:hypothetical protein
MFFSLKLVCIARKLVVVDDYFALFVTYFLWYVVSVLVISCRKGAAQILLVVLT